ncbi:hypothetical protein [Mammaliicoccus sciuri]|uniref:hypothetical protein n=1 Tax=Mammaliicoccus sciuri TaxID=1296 RepID=UPI002B25B605|nr:hypothetical protein [Mammaliicoccus sciuri]WQK75263.1 hypothetical protein P3U33_05895 [Mammaliicoccus sciuri]
MGAFAKINKGNSHKQDYRQHYNSRLVILNSYKTSSYIRRNQKVRMKLYIVKTRNKYTYQDLECILSVTKSTIVKFLNGGDLREEILVKIEKFLNN